MEGITYIRQRIRICKATHLLIKPKRTQGFKSTLPLDHHGDVVDGVVITSTVGMLTLDALGAVGGPACHNK